MPKEHSPLLSKVAVTVGGLLCLLVSWALLFVSMLLLTDAVLNPWDAAPASALPPAGTPSRLLHDLVTRFPTAFLPALVVLGVSVGLFLKQTVLPRKFTPLAFRFAALNVALVGSGAVATPFVWGLERRLLEAVGAPLDYGFHRHTVSLLFWLALLLVWFWLQRAPANGKPRPSLREGKDCPNSKR